MQIEYTDNEIDNRVEPGIYSFLIKDLKPFYGQDKNHDDYIELIMDIEYLDKNHISKIITYRMTIQSVNVMYQSIGKSKLKEIVKGIFPNDWKDRLKKLETNDLIGETFTAEVLYKNDKYLTFKDIKTIVDNNKAPF